MIIWLMALFLLGMGAMLGNYTGAIRVAFSLIGLVLGALLAIPLSPVVKPLAALAGARHPVLNQILAPTLVFLALLVIFKIAGMLVHRKADWFYKYKKSDEELFRWERLNQKLGLCLGTLHGACYFFLMLIPIYVGGYLTVQLASGEEDPPAMRFLNESRAELRASKLDKVVAGLDPAPPGYYDAADVIGLVYHNPLLQSRLSRYPTFLSLAERKEFQDIATDVQINNLIQSQANIAQIIKHPKVQAILTNAQITAEIAHLLSSDLIDLRQYLETGKSVKYGDEKILGIWSLSIDATAAEEKRKRPNLSVLELNRLKRALLNSLYGVTLTATTDHTAVLKKESGAAGTALLERGSWKKEGTSYQVSLTKDERTETVPVTIENEDRLILNREKGAWVFEREL